MASVLFEHERELLPDELGSRHSTLTRRACEELIRLRVQRDRRGLPLRSAGYFGAMGDALKEAGIATWNIEYRRLGETGSGWPGTYLDVGRAVDHVREIAREHHLDLGRVVVVGHSAGGHLAMWTAARRRLPKASALYVADPLPVRGVMDLAGPVDMTAKWRSGIEGRTDPSHAINTTPHSDEPRPHIAV